MPMGMFLDIAIRTAHVSHGSFRKRLCRANG